MPDGEVNAIYIQVSRKLISTFMGTCVILTSVGLTDAESKIFPFDTSMKARLFVHSRDVIPIVHKAWLSPDMHMARSLFGDFRFACRIDHLRLDDLMQR